MRRPARLLLLLACTAGLLAGCAAPRERIVLPPLDAPADMPPPPVLRAPTRGTQPASRNLLVEVRSREVSAQEVRDVGLTGGGVLIGERGVQGRVEGRLDDRSRSARSTATQRVTVLNGGSASVMVGDSRPWRFQSVVWTPRGPAVTQVQGWTDTGRGFSVQPRWSGDGPVEVSISVMQDSGGRAAGTSSRAQAVSTVQTPLQEWTVIASADEQSERSDRRILGRVDQAQARQWVLELRITAP